MSAGAGVAIPDGASAGPAVQEPPAAGSIPKDIVAPSAANNGAPEKKNGKHVCYSTDTDSSAGSGRGRKVSTKRGRSYRKNGKNGSYRHHDRSHSSSSQGGGGRSNHAAAASSHHHHQNGVVRKNGYSKKNGFHYHHRDQQQQKQNRIHNTRGGGGGGGGDHHKRTAMATCYEGSGWGSGSDGPGPHMSSQAAVAWKGTRTSSRASDGTGSCDEGVPSHVGLVHAVLSNCSEAGYDSGSVGGGAGGGGGGGIGALVRSPHPSPPPPPVDSDGLPPPRLPGSHSLCPSDVEQMSTAVNAPESLPGDADSQRSLDLSESQADQCNSDREEPFAGNYRDVDSQRSLDTSSQADTSQADTSQDPGHSDRDSIAGYHSETGAMSDGNSITAPRQYHPSSRGGSVGGMSERSRSSGGAGSTSNDRPPGKVMIARPIQYPPMPPMVVGPGAGFHSLEAIASLHHHFPTASMSYGGPSSEAGKSDNATVNSGSMIEDIDMASIMSGDGSIVIGGGEKGQQRTCTTPQPQSAASVAAAPSSLHQGMLPHHPILQQPKKGGDQPHHKHDRGVEFAAWAQSYPAPHPWLEGQQAPSITSQPSRSPPPPGTIVAVPPTGALLNDMGPPLNRSILLERIAGATGLAHPPTPSGHSRAGSVTFGSARRPSDVSAHIDTDDCGGSLMGSEENRSVHSQESTDHMHERMAKTPAHGSASGHHCAGELSDDNAKMLSALESGVGSPRHKKGMHQGDIDGDDDCDGSSLSSSRTALVAHGRQSPGGTVYKGRGVRRYQGRYMNLPLKRFQCTAAESGTIDVEVEGSVTNGSLTGINNAGLIGHFGVNGEDRPAYWGRERSRSRSRSNSRDRCCRSRERHSCRSRPRSRSRSRDREERSRSRNREERSSLRSSGSRWDNAAGAGSRRRSRRNRGRRQD